MSLLLAVPTAPPGDPFAIPIPANPALLGAQVCSHGASIVPAGGALANALDVTVGDS